MSSHRRKLIRYAASVTIALALGPAPRDANAADDCLAIAGASQSDPEELVARLIGAGKGLARAGEPEASLNSFYGCAYNEIKDIAPPHHRVQLLMDGAKGLLERGGRAQAKTFFERALEEPPAFCGSSNAAPCSTAEANAGLAVIAFLNGSRDLSAKHLELSFAADERRTGTVPIPMDLRNYAVRLFSAVDDPRAADFAWREFLQLDGLNQLFVGGVGSGRSFEAEVLLLEAKQYSLVTIGNSAFSRRLTDKATAKRWLATILRSRGALQDTAARGWRAREEIHAPEDARAARVAAAIRVSMRELAARGGAADEIRRLEAEASYLERELRVEAKTVVRPKITAEAIVDSVAAALAPDQVLVEIIAGPQLSVGGPHNTLKSSPDRYYALVLTRTGEVTATDLGAVAKIDEQVNAMQAALRSRKADPIPAARALYKQVWAPLKLDRSVKSAMLAPEGALQLIPFAALHTDKGYLVDELSISYLTTGRDLLRPPAGAPVVDAVIVASPDFAAGPTPAKQTSPPLFSIVGKVKPLPGTLREAQSIAEILRPTKPVLGAAADERFLRELSAPGILHIATHGLFATSQGKAGGRALEVEAAPGAARQAPQLVDPFNAAALVMAGVDQRSRAGDPDADGFFTAADFIKKDLSQTQLITLSACETGVGDVRAGQGVFGFRRAIMAAGAQSLVTSLWRVDDAATSELMVDFYRGLSAGHTRADALKRAIAAERKRRPHPYYWAPFILIGRTDALKKPAGDAPACLR